MQKGGTGTKPSVLPPDWASRYTAVQLKELKGRPLTPAEQTLQREVDLLGDLLPGLVEDAMLHSALQADQPVCLAAASSTPDEALYLEVVDALRRDQQTITRPVGGEERAVLRLDPRVGLVQPVYLDGYTFSVERSGQEAQQVGRYGGVHLQVDQLKGMTLMIDEADQTIRLKQE